MAMDPQSSFFSSFVYYCGALLAALLLLFILSSSKIKKNKLRYPPSGPLALPLIGHLHLLRDPVHRTLWDIAARHGPLLLLRFGSLPVLLATSAAAAEELLSTQDATFANRPTLLADKYIAYDRSILSSSPYGSRWRSLRRLASMELLSSARLTALSPIRSQELRLLLRSLLLAHSGEDECQLVDVRSRLSEITFNVVTRMVDGRRYYGEGGVGEGRRFRRMVEEIFEIVSATVPEDFIPALRWLGFGKGYIKKMETLFKEMDELLQAMVDERRRVGTWKRSSSGDDQEQEEEEEERNMVDGILKLQESDPEYYNDVLIKGMILVIKC